MARKLNAQKYLNLWDSSNSSSRKGINLAAGNYDNFCKKAIDGLCLEADMAESLDEYIVTFCDGMKKLIELGIPKQNILKHDLALSKILRFGEDIIEYSQNKSDLFYVGLFVDQKIASHWYELPFYKLVKGMLDLLYNKGQTLPLIFKKRIENLIKVSNYPLYALYFIKNRSPGFKNTT
jgi:hypothetical protein